MTAHVLDAEVSVDGRSHEDLRQRALPPAMSVHQLVSHVDAAGTRRDAHRERHAEDLEGREALCRHGPQTPSDQGQLGRHPQPEGEIEDRVALRTGALELRGVGPVVAHEEVEDGCQDEDQHDTREGPPATLRQAEGCRPRNQIGDEERKGTRDGTKHEISHGRRAAFRLQAMAQRPLGPLRAGSVRLFVESVAQHLAPR